MEHSNVTLEEIDFDTVDACTDPKLLAKYVQLLKADGGYFQELLKACEDRLKMLDPKLAQKVLPPAFVSSETVQETRDLLLQWESELRSPQPAQAETPCTAPPRTFKGRKTPSSGNPAQQSPEEEGDLKENAQEEVVRDVEAEITKGLEALKAGDAEEAEQFFSRVIQASPRSAQAYLHRAEARSAQDRHREALEDVQTALALDISLGAKQGGFAMRANLRAEAGMLKEAESDFLKALDVARSAAEKDKVEKQLQFLRAKMSGEAAKRQMAAKPEVFTKVSIVEEDEDEEEEPKIVEIFDDEPAKCAPTTSVRTRRVPVMVVDDE